MPPINAGPVGQNISFGPKRVEKRQDQTVIEKLSVLLLVGAVMVTVGVYAYRFYLQSSLTKIQASIATAEEVNSKKQYDEIVAFDRHVRAARHLLANRVEPSRIFYELESTVSESIFYQSFEAQLDESRSLNLSLGGVSPEFAKIVVQSAKYKDASLLENARVEGIEIREADSGRDTLFLVSARIPSELILSSAPRSASITTPAATSPEAEENTEVNDLQSTSLQ